MEIQIDFGGFYGYHEEYIDMKLEDYEIDSDNVNWQSTFKSYATEWLNHFNVMTFLDLDFVDINSPKYYNYRTDKIIAKVNNADIKSLMTSIDDDNFSMWANPQLQSSSGFHSFYNGIGDLIERAKNDNNDKSILLGMVCNYLIELNEVNEHLYELEYDIIELDNVLNI